jgi:hypothetical protein
MMTVTYALTLSDYLHANRFATRHLRRFFGFVLLVAATASWACGRHILAGVFAFGALVGVPLFYRVVAGYRWRRTTAAQKREETYGLNEIGLHRRVNESNSITTEWDHFLTFRESRGAFLLYLDPAVCLVLPKRALGSADQGEVRMLLMDWIGGQTAEAPQGRAVAARSTGRPSGRGAGGSPQARPQGGKGIGVSGGDGRSSGD